MAFHADQISLYGGTIKLSDAGILESAIELPRAAFYGLFLHAFPFEIAVVYLFHIVNNHPFLDGYKRTGAVAALVFLDWNNVEFGCQVGELADLTLAVATGCRTKKEIADFFQDRSYWKAT
jgi:death-on-curing protein